MEVFFTVDRSGRLPVERVLDVDLGFTRLPLYAVALALTASGALALLIVWGRRGPYGSE